METTGQMTITFIFKLTYYPMCKTILPKQHEYGLIIMKNLFCESVQLHGIVCDQYKKQLGNSSYVPKQQYYDIII